jgi:putative transcriptional regulator
MNQQRLKEIRKAKGFTQEQMAKMLGYKDRSGYWYLENGRVAMTLEKAVKISEILNIDIKEIFSALYVEQNSTIETAKEGS